MNVKRNLVQKKFHVITCTQWKEYYKNKKDKKCIEQETKDLKKKSRLEKQVIKSVNEENQRTAAEARESRKPKLKQQVNN